MLRAAGSPENRERGLAVIERNARAQAKLIEDVLDISRIISGKLSLSLGPTGLAEVITASVETVTPAAQAKDIEIVAHLPTQPLTFTADTQRIQQIIWNLLSNAVKFTPKSGKVTVRAAREGSEVTVEVTDTGEGIPANALPYVFDPFQQADTTTTRRHGGLGLGLAIAKQLVVAHGGVIAAHSAGVGKGSTFVVRLPARGAVIPVSAPQGIASETPTAESSLTRESLEGLRLLVVDDEEDALALVSRVLTVNGAQVHAANSAREALAMLGSLKPDVIVSDIGMPDEDGYSLVRKIRALPAEHGGKTPAIALTAYARAEDAERAFAAGYQLHISKPVDPAHLAAMVARVGGRKLDAAK
jgi:CheY-like chemotaxis protein